MTNIRGQQGAVCLMQRRRNNAGMLWSPAGTFSLNSLKFTSTKVHSKVSDILTCCFSVMKVMLGRNFSDTAKTVKRPKHLQQQQRVHAAS